MSEENPEPTHQELLSRREQLINEITSNMLHSNLSTLFAVVCFGANLWNSAKYWILLFVGWLFLILQFSYFYEFKKLSKELTDVKSRLGEDNDGN